ncbi:aspartyl/glutamyl-tRNA(Asn/Gln) amidotransferase, C subunit [Rubidibacter lacunae KORDI 51-2]|uniref:Aspartyl/glutamyl-tRNA(Asn/Gln) amidotransferase subunit C n=1 Tax=Rubidibacter lacunae KORDI 51-2 TaxID=582515 RepID=U5DAV5_9CHRO|nr:Asp-tRNA(Asn)/Glu-tRNA(Gln) amidotransferase subunit GatC [Rubidibacter lacunae]ERN41678.1 aspartyl/glutamyl-tRNA(Asn/Gln) amidotransferase, C subunit [Rubidibacter lacunae KORDI 51-2]
MLDSEQVRQVANLARMDISEDDEVQFVQQLGKILGYFEQLGELNTEDLPPTARPIEVSNITRSDETQPYSDREVLLARAPEPDGDFFRVPQILNADEG